MVPFDLEAQLTLSTAHGDVMVHAEGGHIRLDIPDLRTARGLMQTWPGRPPWRVILARLRPGLLAAGLTIDLRLRGHTVARLGARALPTFLAQALRLGPVELRPLAIVRTWWRSHHRTPQ